MPALQFKGLPVSAKIQAAILEKMSSWEQKKWKPPKLTVILVGDDPSSEIYVGHKAKMCEKLGFQSEVFKLPANSTEQEVMGLIDKLNQDDSVDGILVQLPLPAHLPTRKILEKIDVEKDADCLTEKNLGRLLTGQSLVKPCTPAGIVEILKHYGVSLVGKSVAIIGRSMIVGTPLFCLLNSENATVTLFHSKSQDIDSQLKNFDIVCVAVGKAHHFSQKLFKSGAIVIDVGVHRTPEGLIGDVDFSMLLNELYGYTPVPGGVGPMTVTMLMQNTYLLAERRRKK